MHYTDRPLPPGFQRILVNYDIKQRGEIMKPRGGYQTLHEIELATSAKRHYIHHVGMMYIQDTPNDDAFLRRYMVIGPKHTDNSGILFSEAQIVIENPEDETLIQSTLDPGYAGTDVLQFKHHANWKKMHDTDVLDPIPVGIVSHTDGNTYVLTATGIVRLAVEWTGTAFRHTLEPVAPKELTPTEAVNYGYNMLSATPYTFGNSVGPSLALHGVLPYSKSGSTLKTNAKVGEHIKFVLVYDYPTGSPQYKVQWEIQDTTVKDNPTILQKVEDSAVYTGGDEIAIVTQPTFKNFSIICKVYDSVDTAEPLKVMVLASYYLTSDSNERSRNLAPKNFDLVKAKDMCTWQNQLVMWGVDGARTTLFISDVNNPAYFPYPQGAVPYDEEIIKALPYLGNQLLVFTSTRLHLLERTPEGVLITRGIQENLDMRTYDAETVRIIKNMVYFKSDNYYYMIVPNNKVGGGELQLAPISENITLLLDNFHSIATRLIDEVYNLSFTLNAPQTDITLLLKYYYNYLDNSKVHNVYKYEVNLENADNIFVELHIIYDTMQRNWSMYMLETNDNIITPYQRVVTEGAIYANVYNNAGKVYAQLIKANPHSAKDTFKLDELAERKAKNYQVLDTGKRDISGTAKKRLREVRFELNNLNQVDLPFREVFMIDDDQRKQLFRYETVHDTDPESPNYGLIYVQRTYEDPVYAMGSTALDNWTLDASQFPPQTVMQVRLSVSGKGYYPRFRLFSVDEEMYELLTIGWVYRMMNAR